MHERVEKNVADFLPIKVCLNTSGIRIYVSLLRVTKTVVEQFLRVYHRLA